MHGESNILIRMTGTDQGRINKVMFVSYCLNKFFKFIYQKQNLNTASYC